MNYAFQGRHPPTELAAMVAEANTTYLNQHQWYADSGANIHVTSDAANLAISQPYEGPDTVGVGNGAGLIISRTGTATIKTPSSTLALNDVVFALKPLPIFFPLINFVRTIMCYLNLPVLIFL